ncbi:MAG: AAA family ATPase [Candidatus Omnitrophica bacterium]|nr:AAA family ATPase [Candidatus Omnitrophota bacterium]
MAKVIAICNQKGGVGKTTTAINLSVYLALSGKRVLLIDIDPQGNATSGLGIDKHNIKSSIYDLIIEEIDPLGVTIKTGINNLSLIPSTISLTGAEVELVGIMGREYRLKKALSPILIEYDFIIIDCPPSLGLLTVNALSAANSVLIPIQCEYYALEGLSQLVNTVNLVRENLNSSLEIEGVLLTMADFRTNLTNEVIKEVRNFFKGKVYETIIPRNIRLTEAPGFGKPIALYDKNSIGAQRYQAFMNELLGVKKETTPEAAQETISVDNSNVNVTNELNKVEEGEIK